jgi:hypothetical protein
MYKSGQVTQEIMSIYGFVLLCVIMILVSFVYFDVGKLSFLKRKDTCAFQSQILCEDFIYDSQSQNITVIVRNLMNFALYNVTIQARGLCSGVGWNMAEDAIVGIPETDASSFEIPCPLPKGSHELALELNFSTDGMNTYQKQGKLLVGVQ